MNPSDPETFYDSYGRREWNRLDSGIDGRLEFEETVAVLDARLPDSGRVLDAGGGAGRYAVWLAERGHDVTLLDLSRRQVELAREHAADRGVSDAVSVAGGRSPTSRSRTGPSTRSAVSAVRSRTSWTSGGEPVPRANSAASASPARRRSSRSWDCSGSSSCT